MGLFTRLLVIFLAVASPAGAAERQAGLQTAVERDVPYAQRPGGRVLAMDIHRPAPARVRRRVSTTGAARRAPAIVWIHGGGFHHGTRDRMNGYARYFAARGYVAATIDYRLQPVAKIRAHGYRAGEHDAQVDAETAIRFLRRHAARYGIDPEHIAVAGYSAGAITALNVAERATGDARVEAGIALAGYGPLPDVDAGDPPLLLFHGTADTAVRFTHSQAMCRTVALVGGDCTLVPFRGLGHDAAITRMPQIARRAVAWLDRRHRGPVRRVTAAPSPAGPMSGI